MQVLRTHLMRLRRKLGEDAANPRHIFAEPRVGYRMPEGETPPVEDAPLLDSPDVSVAMESALTTTSLTHAARS